MVKEHNPSRLTTEGADDVEVTPATTQAGSSAIGGQMGDTSDADTRAACPMERDEDGEENDHGGQDNSLLVAASGRCQHHRNCWRQSLCESQG
jgi:hypothetical protein